MLYGEQTELGFNCYCHVITIAACRALKPMETLMNIRCMILLLTCITAFAITGCGMATTIDSQHAGGISFQKYRSYTWHPQGFNTAGIPIQRAQLAHLAIRTTVDKELTQKGLKPATFEAPDFYITTTVGAVNLTQVRQWGKGTGGYVQGTTEVPLDEEDVREGTIVIDFIDNQSGELIWRATAHGAVETSEDPRPKVESAVRSMMDRYPPK